MHSPASVHTVPRAAAAVWKPGLRIMLLAGAFVFCCRPALQELVRTWSERDLYSYGFLIPVISLLWIKQDRELLTRLPAAPSLMSGLLFVTAAGFMLLLGTAGSMAIVQQLAAVLMVPALVLLLQGTRVLRAVALPLSYLVLTVPILDPVVGALHWPFQLFSAKAAEQALNCVGVPVFRSLQYLELPNATLEVAKACSGVRYLVSTVVLCIPLLFMTQRTLKGRLLLLLLALVLAVAANPLRITLIGLWVYFGHGDVHGPSHLFQGYVVYMMGMAVLFAGAWLFQRMIPAPPQQASVTAQGAGPATGRQHLTDAWPLAVGLLIAFGILLRSYAPEPVPLTRALHEIPLLLGEWRFAPSAEPASGVSIPHPDASLVRVYRNGRGGAVTLRISYLESQGFGKSLFVPELLPVEERGESTTIMDAAGRTAQVKRAIMQDEAGRPLVVLCWYRINGRNSGDRYGAKARMASGGILSRHTQGALVMVSALGEGQLTEKDVSAFAAEFLPVLNGYIP